MTKTATSSILLSHTLFLATLCTLPTIISWATNNNNNNGRTDGLTDGRTGGWTDGWTDRWMDGYDLL